MEFTFEGEITEAEKNRVIAVVLSARNAADSVDLNFIEITVDTWDEKLRGSSRGKKWYCKQTSESTMLCKDKPW